MRTLARSAALLLSGIALTIPAEAQTSRPNKRTTSRPMHKQQGPGAIAKKLTPAPTGRRAKGAARKFRQLEVAGDQVSENVKRLTDELKWHKTLGGALQTARSSKKPLLWIHALGDLKGFL